MKISRRTILKGFAGATAAMALPSRWLPASADEKPALGAIASGEFRIAKGEQKSLAEFLSALSSEKEATLAFRYQPDSEANGSLVTARKGGEVVFGVELLDGHLKASADDAFRYPVASDRRAHLDRGTHCVALRTSEQGTEIFLDGQFAHATTRLFEDRMVADELVAGGGDFAGTISDIQTFSRSLTDQEISKLSTLPEALAEWNEATKCSPDVKLENRIADLGDVAQLVEGTVFVEFSTTDQNVVSLISIGDEKADATDLTLALNKGALVVEHRVSNKNSMKFTVAGQWADGAKHSVCLTTSRYGSVVYADGSEVERHSNPDFVASLGQANGLWLGGNKDVHGEEWKLDGIIHRAAIYNQPFTWQQVAQLSNEPIISSVALFDRGYAGSASYRIPSLLQTQSGVLIACADQRTSNPYDSPNHIQTAMRRSLDGGKTWSDCEVVISQPGQGRQGASVIDTAMVQDRKTGKITIMVDRFPGGGGQANASAGTGHDEKGRKLVFGKNGEKYTVGRDGKVEGTDFEVESDGTLLQSGRKVGNIYLGDGPLKELRTSYMTIVQSADDGATWSEPRDVTFEVKKEWMKFLGTGPGSAIQLESGRILVPVYFNNTRSSANVYSAGVLVSDDGGDSWSFGGSPNGDLDLSSMNDRNRAAHEATICQTSDGKVHMFMRNLGPKVLHSISDDDGDTWTKPVQISSIPDIFSQPNCISLGGREILFSNASRRFPGDSGRRNERGRGVLRLSRDGGETWEKNRVFRPDTYVYSSMAKLDDNQVGILWEMEWDGIYYAQVPIDWVERGCMA
ncbi:exo-alpha-sialidase [Corynebacterium aquilae]|uniref:exo-alpha-sialidase n=1 Tax=Corynebacterium aquilae TaxID=203263 RepID=UPI000A049E63|nr:exo-alpha-sialidase [Corynebacterium aquilae]